MYSKDTHCYILLILGWPCYDVFLIVMVDWCDSILSLINPTCPLTYQEHVIPYPHNAVCHMYVYNCTYVRMYVYTVKIY